jgi:hypothetical protein
MNRIVAAFMSRKDGIPVNQSHFPFLNGSISADDIDLGIGIFGFSGGRAQSRVAIYQYIAGALVFRHVINLNSETGDPVIKAKGLLEADRATINWIKPMMFDDRRFAPGAYSWTDDPPVSIDLVDADEKRRITGLAEFTPSRSFFAQEKTLDLAADDVCKNIFRTADLTRLVAPAKIQLALISSIPDHKDRPDISGVVFPLAEFKAAVTQRFVWGLRSKDGDFRELRYGFTNLMNVVDRMIAQGANKTLIGSTIRRSEVAFRDGAEKHLESQGLTKETKEIHSTAVRSALSALLVYSEDRTTDGSGIRMLRASDSSKRDAPELKTAPLLMIKPQHSIQVIESDNTSLQFPVEAADLFKNEQG